MGWIDSILRANELVCNVKSYGAVGGGIVDDSIAIQLAIDSAAQAGGKGVVYFPADLYKVSNLLLPSQGVTFQGVQDGSASGSYGSFLRASTGTLFRPGSANMNGVHFRDLIFQAVAGHIFDLGTAAVSGCEWVNCFFNTAPDYNAFRVVNGIYIDNTVRGGGFAHHVNATVPTIYMSSDGGAINSNTWMRFRFTDTGLYFAHIESTASSSYCYDNVFRDITAEIPRGGSLRFWGCRNTLVEEVNTYDLGDTPTTQHLISFGKHPTAPGALLSTDNTVRQCDVRNPATLGVGLAHILSSGNLSIFGCNSRIDLASTGNNIIHGPHTGSPAAEIVGISPTDLIFLPGEINIGGPTIFSGAGTPEGVVTAVVGSMFLRNNGGLGTTLYIKESGTGNTGWVSK